MNTATKSSIAGLTGLALVVPLVYLFDPDTGRRRRDKLGSQYKRAVGQLKTRSRLVREGLSDRYQSASTRAKSWLAERQKTGQRTDERLAGAVRMNLWRAVPTSTGIGVLAHNGEVILHGDVLAQERDRVLHAVRSVPGVAKVADHLSPVGEIAPAKVGARLRQGAVVVRDSLAQPQWSAPTRVCAGTVGLALLVLGAERRSAYGGLAALAGAALLTRSGFNKPLRQLATRSKPGVRDALGAVEAATTDRAGRAAGVLHASMERHAGTA